MVDVRVNGVRTAFVKEGEPVTLTIHMCNIKDEPVTLYYRDAQRYDFQIFRVEEPDVAIWRRPKDRAFAEVLGEEELEPKGMLSYEEIWDQVDDEGKSVGKGRYVVRGESVHCDEGRRNCGLAALVFIEID